MNTIISSCGTLRPAEHYLNVAQILDAREYVQNQLHEKICHASQSFTALLAGQGEIYEISTKQGYRYELEANILREHARRSAEIGSGLLAIEQAKSALDAFAVAGEEVVKNSFAESPAGKALNQIWSSFLTEASEELVRYLPHQGDEPTVSALARNFFWELLKVPRILVHKEDSFYKGVSHSEWSFLLFDASYKGVGVRLCCDSLPGQSEPSYKISLIHGRCEPYMRLVIDSQRDDLMDLAALVMQTIVSRIVDYYKDR